MVNFNKIAAGRIDVYETSRTVGYATIAKTLPPEVARQFTQHPKPAAVYGYFVLFYRLPIKKSKGVSRRSAQAFSLWPVPSNTRLA